MSRVAIIGAGNLGAYLGTQLRAAGHKVFFCVRRVPAAMRFEDAPVWHFPFFFRHPPEADIVLITVKAYDTKAALGWLPELCKKKQPVAVIQNGVGHLERVAPYNAIPVLSYVYVELQDGVYRAFLPKRAHFTIPSFSSCNPFADLFANTSIEIEREGAFHTAAWRKMLHNCVSNPLTTIARRGLEILKEEVYLELGQAILEEAFPIAQADGARVKATEGNKILTILNSYPPGTRTSMLQDFERGRRLEIDALNGSLVEMGKKYGLPTAVNEEVVEALNDRVKERDAAKQALKKKPDPPPANPRKAARFSAARALTVRRNLKNLKDG
jgi:2-dehydropantoate 2-reductase